MTTFTVGIDDLTALGVEGATSGYFDVALAQPSFGDRVRTTKAFSVRLESGAASWQSTAGDVLLIQPRGFRGLSAVYVLVPAADLTLSEAYLNHQVAKGTWEPLPVGSSVLDIAAAAEASAVSAAASASSAAASAAAVAAAVVFEADPVNGAGLYLIGTE